MEEILKQILIRLESIEVQQRENTDIVKALIHRTDELDAKFDGLLLTTATKESIDQIDKKLDIITQLQLTQGESINILALRQLQQESEIALLKKAK
jgi:hypothetical protein